MSTTRTDCHRPSAIVPNDYSYVSCEYTRSDAYYGLAVCSAERRAFEAHQLATGGHILHEEGSPCDVCGSPTLKYAMMFHHAPSNAYVRVGEDCAYKLGLGGSAKFNAFKRALKEQVEVYAGKQKAQRILTEAGLAQAWEIAMSHDPRLRGKHHPRYRFQAGPLWQCQREAAGLCRQADREDRRACSA